MSHFLGDCLTCRLYSQSGPPRLPAVMGAACFFIHLRGRKAIAPHISLAEFLILSLTVPTWSCHCPGEIHRFQLAFVHVCSNHHEKKNGAVFLGFCHPDYNGGKSSFSRKHSPVEDTKGGVGPGQTTDQCPAWWRGLCAWLKFPGWFREVEPLTASVSNG